MEITKKEFCATMAKNMTYFCGNTRRIFSEDEVGCRISDLFDPEILLEMRSCKVRSRDLAFSNGSYLGLQSGMTFGKYDYPAGTVLYAYNPKFPVVCYYLIRKF